MTNTQIIAEMAAKGVSDEAVNRVIRAFQDQEMIKRRNAYAREYAKKNKATEDA